MSFARSPRLCAVRETPPEAGNAGASSLCRSNGGVSRALRELSLSRRQDPESVEYDMDFEEIDSSLDISADASAMPSRATSATGLPAAVLSGGDDAADAADAAATLAWRSGEHEGAFQEGRRWSCVYRYSIAVLVRSTLPVTLACVL